MNPPAVSTWVPGRTFVVFHAGHGPAACGRELVAPAVVGEGAVAFQVRALGLGHLQQISGSVIGVRGDRSGGVHAAHRLAKGVVFALFFGVVGMDDASSKL